MSSERRFWKFVAAPEEASGRGRYERRQRLGEGATAVVWSAWDRELNRPVALKLLKEGVGSRDLIRRRFSREAQTVARIRSSTWTRPSSCKPRG